MRDYFIYLIEDEFASHYFGRESFIYHLFLEHKKTSSKKKDILEKQIEYITKPIPSIHIHQAIKSNLKSFSSYSATRNTHELDFVHLNSYAALHIYDCFLHVTSRGSFEAETAFFEILRKYNRCFLAMDFKTDRYGWLNPIKQRKLI
ncbi:sporulation inhibitor of replication protein SirA [Ferdinandcohnia quinoae]|uniref:Sporulation inhibitor of replication protein SirA n=1 Tax=Fredinandcohnia quinoae TaxID=2918902 RepID=A0AAW5DYC4_9BACI|nr:sporulation inhibitor of replication protein SirA [Fredinandcohnia sp. SECRCQ15]MCH1625637.1 sporulation inhibitor of replication protein SirA [Fredinandcohnia sp. SECRCQ15]